MYIVYTKDNCTYCEQAKSLLEQKGLAYKTYKLGQDITRDELIAKIPSARTMPQILRDDRLVGGFMELRKELLAA